MSLSFKTLYKNLQKELGIIHKKTFEMRSAKELEKQRALLTYKKIQLVREKKPTADIEKQLEALENGGINISRPDSTVLKQLVSEVDLENDELAYVKLQHMDNVAKFLESQRVYNELIERYNPGLTMTQEDKVRRTANKVGLSVPDN